MELNGQPPRKRKKPVIVAILAMHDDGKPFRGNSQNFVDLIETGLKHGVHMYVITPRDFQLKRRSVPAYAYDRATNTWVRQHIPRPAVIYNRLPYRKDEESPEVQEILKKCMEHPHVRIFNPSFFNKWQLFEWLRKSQTTRTFIPHTVQWGRQVRLLPLFAKSPLIYLKPESGKAGAGIMLLRRLKKARQPYVLNIQSGKAAKTYRFRSIKRLKHKLHTLIGKERYIVQQGILLSHHEKRPFDLRVLVQKNGRGVWSLTGIGARIAGSKSITTHVPRGGSIDDPKKLLSAVFGPEEAERILRRVRIAALSIARQIESGSQSALGEMSMDIGVDAKGQLWFFEANSKPMKFDEPHIREKSLVNIVLYCKYLANRPKRKKKDRGA